MRAVIANLGGTGKIGPLVKFTLKPLEALEFDCTEIAKNLEQTAPFIKGFVDIISPAILSVVAVYTAEQRGGPAPVSIERRAAAALRSLMGA